MSASVACVEIEKIASKSRSNRAAAHYLKEETMTLAPRSVLQNILIEHRDRITSHTKTASTDLIDAALSQLKSLVLEAVGKRYEGDYDPKKLNEYYDGWNDCIAEIRAKMEKLFGRKP